MFVLGNPQPRTGPPWGNLEPGTSLLLASPSGWELVSPDRINASSCRKPLLCIADALAAILQSIIQFQELRRVNSGSASVVDRPHGGVCRH